MMNYVVAFLSGGAFILIGCAVLVLSVLYIFICIKVRRWQVVSGEVLEARLDFISSPRSPRWLPVVKYKYSANGWFFVSDKHSVFGFSSGMSGGLNGIIGKLKPGDKLNVYCDGLGGSLLMLPRVRYGFYTLVVALVFIFMGFMSMVR